MAVLAAPEDADAPARLAAAQAVVKEAPSLLGAALCREPLDPEVAVAVVEEQAARRALVDAGREAIALGLSEESLGGHERAELGYYAADRGLRDPGAVTPPAI